MDCKVVTSWSRCWLPVADSRPVWTTADRLKSGMEYWRLSLQDEEQKLIIHTTSQVETDPISNFTRSTNEDGLHTLYDIIEPFSSFSCEKLLEINLEGRGLETLETDFGNLLPNLKVLNLNGNSLRNLDCLANCTSLTHLSIQGNRITNFCRIGSSMTQLKCLNLSGNGIQILSKMNLPDLTSLDLSRNRIESTSGALWNCKSLQKLDLSCNALIELQDIICLDSLIRLDLHQNQIQDTRGLCLCSKLVWLDLSENNLRGSFPSFALPCLTTLYVSDNEISSFESDCFLPSLTLLSIRGNQVSSIRKIGDLYSLTTLDLSFNHLASESSLWFLERLRRLRSLRIKENQVEFSALDICTTIPWLITLNHDVVSRNVQKRATQMHIARCFHENTNSYFPLFRNLALLHQAQLWFQESGGIACYTDLHARNVLEFLQMEQSFKIPAETQSLHFFLSTMLMGKSKYLNEQQKRVSCALEVMLGRRTVFDDFVRNVTTIQKGWRMRRKQKMAAQELQRAIKAAHEIQKKWRCYSLQRKIKLELHQNKNASAQIIQRYYKAYRVQKQFRQAVSAAHQFACDLAEIDTNSCDTELAWIQEAGEISLQDEQLAIEAAEISVHKIPEEGKVENKTTHEETCRNLDDTLKQWGFKNEETKNNYYKSWAKKRLQLSKNKMKQKLTNSQARLKVFHQQLKRFSNDAHN